MKSDRPLRPVLGGLVAWLGLCALSALGLFALSASAAQADFYTPPNPLPAGRPGDVIRSERATADELPAVPLPAHAWRILYRSTTATGKPTAVSGTVLVPTTRWNGPGSRPLVGYAIGTQGLATKCAPSLQLASGTEYEASLIANVLNRGWAVALTDYPGLGTPGLHPYVVGRALGPSVLDAMRAALRLRAAGLDAHAPLGIYGYSEGGEAAGWALQLARTYAPDLKLSGGIVGAAPANFNAEYHYLEGGRLEFLIMYTALGMNSAYPHLQLDNYLNARGRAFAAEMRGSCISDAVAKGQLEPTNISAFTTSNPIGRRAWQQAFSENDLGGVAPHVPVLLGAGQHDEVMDYATAGPGLYHAWCAHGANVSFDEIQPGLEHIADAFPFSSTALAFLAERFAGQRVVRPAGCVSAATPSPHRAACHGLLRLRLPAKLRQVKVRIAGRAVHARRHGRRLTVPLTGSGRVRVVVTGRRGRRGHYRKVHYVQLRC
jgi:hypothetical protein